MVTRALGARSEGQGQLAEQPARLFGALQTGFPPFPVLWGSPESSPGTHGGPGLMTHPRVGGNGLIPGGARCHCLHRHNAPSLPCPRSPSALCPGMGQKLFTSGQRPGMRAKGHQMTGPEKQAFRAGVGWRWDWPAQRGHSAGLSDPTRWDTRPRTVPSVHFLPLCLKCHRFRNPTAQSMGNTGAYRQLCHKLSVTLASQLTFPPAPRSEVVGPG